MGRQHLQQFALAVALACLSVLVPVVESAAVVAAVCLVLRLFGMI